MTDINLDEVINKYENGVGLKENANAGIDTLTMRDSFMISEFHKAIAMNKCIAADYHRTGALHIHDMGTGIDRPYCCGYDLRDLLRKGLGVSHGTSSKPAKHMVSVIPQMVEQLQIGANEFAGAQAYSSVDTLLAPFIYYDGLTYEEVRQQMKHLIYHLNYPSRQALQTPFSNLSFDWDVPEDMKDQNVIIGGELMDKTYGDFQEYVSWINQAFIEEMMKGDKYGQPFTFPIPTFNLTPDNLSDITDMESERARKLWELTAKFGSPYFMNFIGTDMNPGQNRAMCCRLNLDLDEISNQTGGIWNIGTKTGSIAIVTINLNRVALKSQGSLKKYFKELKNLFYVTVKQLLQRKEYVFDAYARGRIPYAQEYLGDGSPVPEDAFRSFFLTIGTIGAWEAWCNLCATDINVSKDYSYTQFCKDVMDFLREEKRKIRGKEFCYDGQHYSSWHLWNIEQTPAEGAAYRLAQLDRQLYPESIISGNSDNGIYLTNSTHLPVEEGVDTFNLYHRSETDRKYDGGTLMNIYSDEGMTASQVNRLVVRIAGNTDIPYLAYTPTHGVCGACGRITYGSMSEAMDNPRCAYCGEPIELNTRVVGYIRSVNRFNPGQFSQFLQRNYMDENTSQGIIDISNETEK